MTDRAEIEAALEPVAAGMLLFVEGKKPVSGWMTMIGMGFQIKQFRGAQIPVPSDTNMTALVDLAGQSPHAFDAAAYVAGHLVAIGCAVPLPLRLFAAQVLTGEIKRPPQRGRPRSEDVLLKAQQYALALFTHKNGDVPLARNDISKTFSACDAVADAFTKCGRRTTYESMKSLCYAANYADVRHMGKLMYGAVSSDVERASIRVLRQ